VVAVMGRLFLPRKARKGAGAGRVVEHELDMQRRGRARPSVIVKKIGSLLRWLMPTGGTIAPPMRSIDRELWETSNER
jgi:hypothetical protein